jgi:hypothetical protein
MRSGGLVTVLLVADVCLIASDRARSDDCGDPGNVVNATGGPESACVDFEGT